MQQRKIIIFITVLFLASSIWLFFAGQRSIDPDRQGEWWALYFTDPKSNDADFVIENHTLMADFHWEALKDDQRMDEGDVKIEKGANQKIEPRINSDTGKIIIKVNAGSQTKEIYKNR